jgi:protein-S-isoprenylcysteine O-methyltransferase Ste14
MISSRLQEQGFINLHRKVILRLAAIGLLAFLFYAPSHWELHGNGLLAGQMSGAIMVFAGILGRILSTITIGGHKDRTIVRTELYSITRNPLYFSSFLMALGVGLLSGRMDFLALLAVCYLSVFYPMMRNEAAHLRDRFDEYADYEKSVPLFFPNFCQWNARERFEVNFRLVRRTALDAAITLAAIPVMMLFRVVFEQL